MKYSDTILAAIGNTPLVKLNKIVPEGAASIYVKCEFMNPTGSIKDRMALHVVEQAEKKGVLKPGGTIVENTSGNTGLALAMVGAVKGYRCVFTMPDKMSQEKIDMMKSFGAEVVVTATDVPGDSPEHYVNVAKKIAEDTPDSLYVNQYHNQLNIEAHYRSTGAEIWEQTGGDFDYFVAGTGTGGTASGVGRFIKEKNKETGKNIQVIGVDPIGSVHYHYFYTQTLVTPHVYQVEGVGEDILCEAMDFSVVDRMFQTNDKEAFTMARRLVREEGFFCGGGSGSIIHGAVELAKEVGPDKKIVSVLTDSGSRYISKFLSDAWMKDHGYLESRPELGFVEEILRGGKKKVVTATGDQSVSEIVQLFKDHGISQVPIVDSDGKPIGIVHEIDVLRSLQLGETTLSAKAKEICHDVTGLTSPKARMEELFKVFELTDVAVVVDNQKLVGIVSKIDLIDYMAASPG